MSEGSVIPNFSFQGGNPPAPQTPMIPSFFFCHPKSHLPPICRSFSNPVNEFNYFDLQKIKTLINIFSSCLFALIFRMDQDKSLNISYDEWRDFLLLAPSSDLHDILRFWRHSTVSYEQFIPSIKSS